MRNLLNLLVLAPAAWWRHLGTLACVRVCGPGCSSAMAASRLACRHGKGICIMVLWRRRRADRTCFWSGMRGRRGELAGGSRCVPNVHKRMRMRIDRSVSWCITLLLPVRTCACVCASVIAGRPPAHQHVCVCVCVYVCLCVCVCVCVCDVKRDRRRCCWHAQTQEHICGALQEHICGALASRSHARHPVAGA